MTSGVYYTKALNDYVLSVNEQEKLEDTSIIKYIENLTENESKKLLTSISTLATYSYSFNYLGTTYEEEGSVSFVTTNTLMSGFLGGTTDNDAIKNQFPLV